MKTSAESSIAELESLEPGTPWAELLASSTSVITSRHAIADGQVFPSDVLPVDANTRNQYVDHTGSWPAIGYPDRGSDLHRRCVTTHPELARCLRTPEFLDDVAAAAARQAAPASHLETFAVAGARAAAEAIRRYKLGIASQLAAVDGHELQGAARELLACEALRVRLDAAKQRHEQHAADELACVEADRRAAARVVLDKTASRVREAAARAEDARVKALASEHEYRLTKAAALVERLRLSNLQDLRVGSEGEVYGVPDLIGSASAMSLQQLARIEAALAAQESA